MAKTDGIRALEGLLHDLSDDLLMTLVASETRPELIEFLKTRPAAPTGPAIDPQYVLAAARRVTYQRALRSINGFRKVRVPQLNVRDAEYQKALAQGMDYFFIPITTQADYDRFMTSVGQANHWTVTNESERAKIGWDFTSKGYWIKVEVNPTCPRIKTSWNDLTRSVHLLSLVEYVVVWHLHKMLTNTMLDQSTWTWLRTRYGGSGALGAGGSDGGVGVGWGGAEHLSVACDYDGGRLAEVVS